MRGVTPGGGHGRRASAGVRQGKDRKLNRDSRKEKIQALLSHHIRGGKLNVSTSD